MNEKNNKEALVYSWTPSQIWLGAFSAESSTE